jgi:hypothetical protein
MFLKLAIVFLSSHLSASMLVEEAFFTSYTKFYQILNPTVIIGKDEHFVTSLSGVASFSCIHYEQWESEHLAWQLEQNRFRGLTDAIFLVGQDQCCQIWVFQTKNLYCP